MIHSNYHKKYTNEDPKTSTVFETLLMLPDEMLWSVLRKACCYNENLPLVSGFVESYDFWPHWYPSGTINKKLVEPDLFVRFQQFDLIVEAKYGENGGQYFQQWEKEIVAYHNEYGFDKPVHFIAIGGNADKSSESVKLSRTIIVNKCTWLSLLIQITRLREEYSKLPCISSYHSSLLRLLKLIETGFNIHRVYNIHWFNELATPKTKISEDSLTIFKTFFR